MKSKMKNTRSCSVDLKSIGNQPPRVMMDGPKPNVNKGALKTKVGPGVRGMMKSFKRA